MSTITFSLQLQNAFDAEDKLAARKLIRAKNKEITAANLLLAAQVPPGTPLPLLPLGTNAELKASTESLLVPLVTGWWASYIQQAKDDRSRFTEAEWTQIKTNLNARLDAGETPAGITTDTST